MIDLYDKYHIKQVGVTKKGVDVYTMDLVDYVKDCLMDGDYRTTAKDYVVNDPIAYMDHRGRDDYGRPYRNYKLYVEKGILEGSGVGHSFVRNAIYIEPADESKIVFDFTIPEFIGQTFSTEKMKPTDPLYTLENFHKLYEDDPLAKEYLKSRHKYLPEMADKLGFRYTNHHQIAVPFYIGGELISYQIKVWHDMKEGQAKYHTPQTFSKPIYILERGSNKDFMISEGTFDALANFVRYPEVTPCAVLGSSISDDQVNVLRSYIPNSVTVYMDKTDLSVNVGKKIQEMIPYCDVTIIPSDGTDPEEALIAEINDGKSFTINY